MKSVLVVGNWKLHGSQDMVNFFLTKLFNSIGNVTKFRIAIAPPVMYLNLMQCCLERLGCDCIHLCAQHVDVNLYGAFTGDVSAAMLKDCHVKYVIIGHSERRICYQENDSYIAKKFFMLKKVGLIPILCVGENLAEYNAGLTRTICMRQISVIIKLLGVESLINSVIAYEPVWAIGQGKSATPTHVQNVSEHIREYIAKYDFFVAENILIQYGGSVIPENVALFINQKDINGVLVGGCSLNAESFTAIIKIVDRCIN